MKRKIFSKLLMGALLIASVSSFVSCKDYDDDINRLEDQINKAALQSNLDALQQKVDQNATTAAAAAANALKAAQDAAAAATNADATLKSDLEKAIAAVEATAKTNGNNLADAVKAISDLQAAVKAAQDAADAAATAAAGADAKAGAAATPADVEKAAADAKAALDKAVSELNAAIEAAQKAALEAAQKAQETADKAQSSADAAAAAEKAQATANAAATKAYADEIKTLAEEAKAIANEAKAALANGASKEEFNTLSTKVDDLNTDLTQKIGTINSKIADIEANYATKTYVDDKVAGLQNADQVKAAIAAALSQYGLSKTDETVASQISTAVTSLQGELAQAFGVAEFSAIQAKFASVNSSVEAIYTVITSVDIYYTNPAGHITDIYFTKVREQENKFPVDAKKAEADKQYVFTQDKYITYEDEMIIRVSPASVNVTPEMIEMINSQGTTLTSEVSIVSVTRYNGLLTRASDGNGLWTVRFKLKDGYDENAFLASTVSDTDRNGRLNPWRSSTTGTGDNNISFAVAVNNTKDAAADRRIISAYDVIFNTNDALHAGWFRVKVGNNPAVPAQFIHNRYTASEIGTATNTIEELVWKPLASGLNPAYTTVTTNASNPADTRANAFLRSQAGTAADDRQAQPFVNVEVNEDILIDFPNAATMPLKGFYVTLDRAFAVESAPSEINAWDSYEYDNVGTLGKAAHMFDGNSGTIRIKSANAQGDYIGFRVYAVNLDGTLVDPDGRAFYVHVGATQSDAALAGSILVDGTKAATAYYESDFVAVGNAFNGLGRSVFAAGPEWNYTALTPSGAAAQWPRYNANGSATQTGSNIPATYEVLCYNRNKVLLGNINALQATGTLAAGIDPSQISYIKFRQTGARAPFYINDGTYYATVEVSKIVAGASVPIKTITFALTKKIPNTYKPLEFRPKQEVDPTKANVFANGNDKEGTGYFISYMIPTTAGLEDYATLTTLGTKDLNNVFYRLDPNYEFSFAASVKGTGGRDVANTVQWTAPAADGISYSYILNEIHDVATPANGLYIDGRTWHDVNVNYMYRGVSTYWNADTRRWVTARDHAVAGDVTYHTMYACWHNAQSFSWRVYPAVGTPGTAGYVAARNMALELQWSAPAAAAQTRALADIQGANSYDNTRFGKDLNTLTTNGWLTVTTGGRYAPHLNTKADATGQVDPYFSVTYAAATGFTFNQASTQIDAAPTANHTEYLIFYVTDAFRHPVMVSLPVTVKAPARAARAK